MSNNKGAGRRTKCTAELTEAIAETLRAGNYLCVAAEANGISEATIHAWRARGREELERLADNPRARGLQSEAIFVEFLEATMRAEGEAEQKCVRLISAEIDDGNVDAAFRYLERRHPQRWGKRTHEVTIGGTANVHVFLPQEDPDDE